jgi:hypothetical protein
LEVSQAFGEVRLDDGDTSAVHSVAVGVRAAISEASAARTASGPRYADLTVKDVFLSRAVLGVLIVLVLAGALMFVGTAVARVRRSGHWSVDSAHPSLDEPGLADRAQVGAS